MPARSSLKAMAARRRTSTTQRPPARRPARKPRKTPPTEPAPLLVIDQTPILKKALSQCRRLRNELNKKQARLRRFEEEDIPAYQRWYHVEFGAGLTALRELRETLAAHEFIYEQLGYCEFHMPEKLGEVHAELMRRLKEGTLHAFVPPKPENAREDEAAEDFDDIFDDFDEAFGQAFDEFFGTAGEDAADERVPTQGKRTAPHSPQEAALKALYRTLAKRLHPDHSDLEEDLRERRWHELQAAYEAHDLETLRRIDAVCDMEDAGGLSIRLGLSRLREFAAYHRAHVQPIRDALRQAKRHPAFDFGSADPAALRQEVAYDLEAQRYELSDRLEWLRSVFQEIAEDCAFDPAPEEPPAESEADRDDFWDSYTAWRDEELSRSAGR